MIGITTAPRSISTVEKTVDSLIKSGVSRKEIILFCDCGFEPPINITKVIRPSKLGAWKNWYESLKYLYENDGGELLYLFQDDVIFGKNWWPYFLNSGLPEEAAIYSIFSPAQYSAESVGWQEIVDPSLWMAQGLIIKRAAAEEILNSKIVWTLRGDRQIDNRLGLWLFQSGRKIFFHTPSLAEHIGETSTLWEDATIEGNRKSRDFAGTAYDCLKLLV